MKRIHINETQLNEIQFGDGFCAGTDQPYYENEETGEVYEATWNGDYGFPFGYWPIDYNGNMEFSVGDAYTTHANACGKCAEEYFNDSMYEQIDEAAYQLSDAMESFASDFQEYGYQYNEETDLWVSADGSDERDLDDFINEIEDQVSSPIDMRDYISEFVENFTQGDTNIPSSSEIYEYMNDNISEAYDFRDEDGINDAMKQLGMDFYQYFEMGRNEGRIWPEREMIGFYESEQPDPETLCSILYALQDNGIANVSDMFQYHMVFEDWRNDGTITACTIQDYVDGNYGPESYEDEESDEPIQYSNGQKTVFVPHLANQDQKREYFKDFRNTRDRAVYTPREKAAGNLAAYHAMRYPYGESEKKIGNIIKEVINKTIKMEG